MTKVLVTGLGTAKDFGICSKCGLDFSWLTKNPSVLLWADEICIPEEAFNDEKMRQDEKSEKMISMFLKKAEDHNVVKKINVKDMYQESVGDDLYNKMLKDSETLLKTFPGVIEKGRDGVPDELIIENEGYCGIWMASVYAGLRLARDIDANCLFSKREHNFLKYLYGAEVNRRSGSAINMLYNEIFSLYLPESISIHNYAFTSDKWCDCCEHIQECKATYLSDSEEAIEKLLKWRDYDEIQQVKLEIEKICQAKGSISTEADIKDIIKEFKEKQDKINVNIRKRFPKAKRWTKMTTVMATPITIAASLSGNTNLAIGSAVATGLAGMAEQLMEVYESKNNWVGFVNDMKDM